MQELSHTQHSAGANERVQVNLRQMCPNGNKLLLCDCYRLNVCAPPPTNSYVVILTPDVLVLVVRIGGC